jgi:hypothetical protein
MTQIIAQFFITLCVVVLAIIANWKSIRHG